MNPKSIENDPCILLLYLFDSFNTPWKIKGWFTKNSPNWNPENHLNQIILVMGSMLIFQGVWLVKSVTKEWRGNTSWIAVVCMFWDWLKKNLCVSLIECNYKNKWHIDTMENKNCHTHCCFEAIFLSTGPQAPFPSCLYLGEGKESTFPCRKSTAAWQPSLASLRSPPAKGWWYFLKAGWREREVPCSRRFLGFPTSFLWVFF